MAEIIYPCKNAALLRLKLFIGINCLLTNKICVCSYFDSFLCESILLQKTCERCPGYERNEKYGIENKEENNK